MTTPHSTGVDDADMQITRVYEAETEEALNALLASKCKPGYMVHGTHASTNPNYRVMVTFYMTEDGTPYRIFEAAMSN